MQCNPSDSMTTDEILVRCLLLFARRGAQIRAELRAQYGIAEGDQRMSELAREAERKLWPAQPHAPSENFLPEVVGGLTGSTAEPLDIVGMPRHAIEVQNSNHDSIKA